MPTGSEGGLIFKAIDRVIGAENVQQPREHFKRIAIEKHEAFQRWNDNKKHLQHEAALARDRARDSTWDQIAVLLGAVGVLLSFLPIIPTAAGVASLALTLVTGLRRAAVEMLLYEMPYEIRTLTNVKFACAWNRAMNGWTSLLVVPLGVVFILMPQSYRIGFWVIAEETEKRYGKK